MRTYLYLLSIGPVQSFIAQARKTQDLYQGSRLLSDLCRIGIEYVLKKYQGKDKDPDKAKCIFPGNKKAPSLPNRFLIQFQSEETEQQLEAFGREAVAHLKEKFVREAGMNRLAPFYNGEEEKNYRAHLRYLKEDNLRAQLEQLLDIHWVIVPVQADDEKGYEQAYAQAWQLLAVAKNAAPFGQARETGRKCSVCGIRNVRFYRCSVGESRDVFPNNEAGLKRLTTKKLFHDEKAAGEAAIYHSWDPGVKLGLSDLQPGEGLCAVCAAKRFDLGGDFPSTAQVALMHTHEQAFNGNDASEAWMNFRDCFSVPGKSLVETFNWQFFYEENISSIDTIEKSGFQLGKHKQEQFQDKDRHFAEIQARHLQLSQRLRELQLPLEKYYSLIVFDGDRMGGWLSGKNNLRGVGLEPFHHTFSTLLSNYAEWVSTEFLDVPHGKVIYAGGDDFMGLACLQHLYPVLEGLRDGFDRMVNLELKKQYNGQLAEDAELTFSAGVVIAHYKTPLQEVLRQARRLERMAKDRGGRNALALGLLQRTGSMRVTCWPWYYRGEKTISLLKKANELLRPDKLSDTFARELIRFLQPLMSKNGGLPFETSRELEKGYLAMVKAKLQRLAQRSTGPGLDKKKALDFTSELFSLASSPEAKSVMIGDTEDGRGQEWRARNFLRLLELMLFMSNHTILEQEKTTAI